MGKPSTAPPSTPSSPTQGGSPPSASSGASLFLTQTCAVCGTSFQVNEKRLLWHRKQGNDRFGTACSKSCARKKWHQTNPGKSYFVGMPPEQRGKATGVVRSAAYRQQMSETHKAKGYAPKIRGGNGTGMTKAEAVVRAVLPAYWIWSFPVPLGARQQGYPTNYKLDFANPSKRLGLEIDGASHGMHSRKIQDKKKEAKLAELGWSVLRISNTQALSLSTTSSLKEHLTTLLGEAF